MYDALDVAGCVNIFQLNDHDSRDQNKRFDRNKIAETDGRCNAALLSLLATHR